MPVPARGAMPLRGNRADPADRVALFPPSPELLLDLYGRLIAHYGEQPWWPAESPFEIAVGAVLTQNAAWRNVEKAIAALKREGLLSLTDMLAAAPARIGEAIRPSGYFNVKAQRLRNLSEFLDRQGGLAAFAEQPLAAQRDGLLGVNGIGPETADDILLYALNRPVFVIDTYTRRLLQRHRVADGTESYEALRAGFERALAPDVYRYQQYHALIVTHAKAVCRKTPICAQCFIARRCPTASD